MGKRKVRKMRITKGEKILYQIAVLCFSLTILIKIFCGAGTQHLSMSVEKVRYEINSQEKKNESLTMQVNELTAFDKIKDIVKDMGLAYNNDNIIVIDNE